MVFNIGYDLCYVIYRKLFVERLRLTIECQGIIVKIQGNRLADAMFIDIFLLNSIHIRH